ncbi:MAG: DUF2007 domain-containing protein [Gemmataceae bacterium]
MSENPSDEIVRVATAPNPPVAHIWEQALKEEGIRCKIVGDYLDAAYGDIPGLRAEVWVHKEDAERAEAIIRQLEAAVDTETDEDE